MKSKLLIVFDLDDTIFNSSEAEKLFAIRYLKINPNDKIWDTAAASVVKQLGLKGQSYDDLISSTCHAIMSGKLPVRPKPHAVETIRKVQELGFATAGLTGRKDIHWQNQATEFSKKQLESVGIHFDNVIANCEEKGKWCKEHNAILLVEDNPKFARQANELDIHTLLIKTEFNETYEHSLNNHFSTWIDFIPKALEICGVELPQKHKLNHSFRQSKIVFK